MYYKYYYKNFKEKLLNQRVFLKISVKNFLAVILYSSVAGIFLASGYIGANSSNIVDEECRANGFSSGTAKWHCDSAFPQNPWLASSEISLGTNINGSCNNAFWSANNSGASGVVIKTNKGSYVERGQSGSTQFSGETISSIAFCGMNSNNANNFCGNGIIEIGEECDRGSENGRACSPTQGSACGYCSSSCRNQTVLSSSPSFSSSSCQSNVDVMIVLDVSGSMNNDSPARLSQAKIAANNFLNRLDSSDQSGLVFFSTNASVGKNLSNNHETTKNSIQSLSADGATNIGDAILLANNELTSSRANSQNAKIQILLTDGRANKPNGSGFGENSSDVALAESRASQAAGRNIKVFTVGVGNEINETMLRNIANATGGQFHFSSSGSGLDSIFNQIGNNICGTGVCGNFVIDPGEQCDGSTGITAGQVCTNICTILSSPSPSSSSSSSSSAAASASSSSSPSSSSSSAAAAAASSASSSSSPSSSSSSSSSAAAASSASSPSSSSSSAAAAAASSASSSSSPSSSSSSAAASSSSSPSSSSSSSSAAASSSSVSSSFVSPSSSICQSNVDVMVVLDVSGSMNNDIPTRLSQAKNSANNFLNRLDSSDQSGLVFFSTNAILDKTLSLNHQATKNSIINLSADGATNIGDAILLANNELTSSRANSQNAKIQILLTDGRANKPNGSGFGENAADVALAESRASQAAGRNIKIFTVGIGNEINETMLRNIANATGGQFHFSSSGSGLDSIFNQIGNNICGTGVCGNAVRDAGEQCDAGSNNGLSCSPSYGNSCSFCSNICQNITIRGGFCGDGVRNGNEECDGATSNSSLRCSSQCRFEQNIFNKPALTINKTVDRNFTNPGGEAEFIIRVTNNGDITAFNAIVEDSLPEGLTFQDGGGSKRSFNLGNLTAGAIKTISFKVRVNNNAKTGKVANIAQVKADNHGIIRDDAFLEIREVEVLGTELAPTGFSMKEFLLLISMLGSSTGLGIFLRKKIIL